jgi:predicted ribosome quality control (RQC) complex YloA/Tae2 family protein
VSVRYDPLLCSALVGELTAALSGRPLSRLYLNRETRTAVLAPREGPALVMLLHPTAGHILHRQWSRPQGEVATPAAVALKGLSIADWEAPPDERLISAVLRGGSTEKRLVLELQTNQWNLMLVGQPANRIEALLWTRRSGDRRLRQGGSYASPRSRRNFATGLPSRDEWLALLRPVPAEDRRRFMLSEIAYASAINVDYLIHGSESESGAGGEAQVDDGDWAERARVRYAALRNCLSGDADYRPCLLQRKLGLQPYVADLGETDATPTGSVLAAMDAAFTEWRDRRDDDDAGARQVAWTAEHGPEMALLRSALTRRRARLRRRYGALRHELDRGPSAMDLRSTGDLLLARLSEVPRGATTVRLTDFEGKVREIELDPRREPADNAARYYQRAARRERAESELPRQLAELELAIGRVEATIEGLPERGVSEKAWQVAGGRPDVAGPAASGAARPGGRQTEAPRLPYRRLRTSGGLELRVGRGARHNDALTLRHSAPEDIWLHARQVKGAHVVLRWGRRDANPPQRDLLEAAVAAAVNSEARHSGTVAVDWTRRKYVRKPRKAPPGVVVPERVKTLFVEPDEGLLKRLAEEE